VLGFVVEHTDAASREVDREDAGALDEVGGGVGLGWWHGCGRGEVVLFLVLISERKMVFRICML
jgi:hypothetical protein